MGKKRDKKAKAKAKRKANKGKDKIAPLYSASVLIPESINEKISVQASQQTTQEKDSNSPERSEGNKTRKIEWLNFWINTLIASGAVAAVILAIQANKTTNEIFKTVNMPYLQIKDLRISNDTLFYTITNVGEYPAEVISVHMSIWATDRALIDSVKPIPINEIGNYKPSPLPPDPVVKEYITKDYPAKKFFTGVYRNYSPVLRGSIIYRADGITENRLYDFEINLTTLDFIKNKNVSYD